MSADDANESVALLRELRDQQRLQLDRQSEALELQRESVAMLRQQFERAEKLQTRAEALQANSGKAMAMVKWIIFTVIVLLALAMGLLFWRILG